MRVAAVTRSGRCDGGRGGAAGRPAAPTRSRRGPTKAPRSDARGRGRSPGARTTPRPRRRRGRRRRPDAQRAVGGHATLRTKRARVAREQGDSSTRAERAPTRTGQDAWQRPARRSAMAHARGSPSDRPRGAVAVGDLLDEGAAEGRTGQRRARERPKGAPTETRGATGLVQTTTVSPPRGNAGGGSRRQRGRVGPRRDAASPGERSSEQRIAGQPAADDPAEEHDASAERGDPERATVARLRTACIGGEDAQPGGPRGARREAASEPRAETGSERGRESEARARWSDLGPHGAHPHAATPERSGRRSDEAPTREGRRSRCAGARPQATATRVSEQGAA